MDGRALAKVQRSGLQGHGIRRAPHFAPKGVDLIDQMPLSRSADGGVAGQIGERVKVEGKKDGVRSHTGGGQSRFDSGVTRADYCNLCFPCHMALPSFLPLYGGAIDVFLPVLYHICRYFAMRFCHFYGLIFYKRQ